ncbi:MAG: histidyl-tRNA synthetase, histidyl-tRNA synthetase [Candidatus Wolfebacteria bacterium GW2011_GWC1_43_10]|uniref:Histidine--tRNA ligase n=2 Tax=Candidatus Wolfeibacteriota TaxID=1752735 RepID=A0A0G1F7W8_9BACT|nr:MAG: histidyl-tRNA synthetase, histidyl-tRNA synthetase [Candidatus Wolfebacteria bacterium GW2011_GWC1_43_10]KKT22286.1 MAG: Histidine-tRNA ligase [Parcubacteria group bacterium GW2011_GWB1_43_8b]
MIRIPKAKRKQKKPESSRKSRKFPFQSPKGMHDILPGDFVYFDRLEKSLRKVACFFDFSRIEPTVLEDIRLFERGTGMTSEIVKKQMFLVKSRSRKEPSLALRSEYTPGVFRAYIQSGLSHTMTPAKFYYLGPVFRYEQPQHGRFRQFYQMGFEILNSTDPVYDAQIISATHKFFNDLRLKGLIIKINSIGCRVCRPAYVRKLRDYYKNKSFKICRDCIKRLKENPLRILDCKEEKCQPYKTNAPQILDHLCGGCKNHLKTVLEYLDESKIPYMIDPVLVRGLDYYSRTVFEVFAEGVDFALAGGGRYDYLSESLWGSRMGAVGISPGVERIIEAMKLQEVSPPSKNQHKLFLIYMGEEAKKKAFALMESLFKEGIIIKESFSRESLKSQLRQADKEGAELTLILGQREVFEDVVILRDMKSGNQETVPIKRVAEELRKRM